MTISLDDLHYLASDSGARLLDRLSSEDLSEGQTLKLLTTLRRDVTPSQAGAALELARLRLKARSKFGDDAARMFFTAEALEQASDPLVRQYRARAANGLRVVDACCGIGADSLAFARAGGDVLGLDIDPVRVAMARLNADALGLNTRFEVADVRDGLPAADFAFYDPARRDSDGRRIYDVERYQPALSLVRGWTQPLIAAKLSPGVELAQLAPYGGLIEFISVEGELKEAALWLGTEAVGLRAVLLTAEGAHTWQAPDTPSPVSLSEPRAWLVEPDPAILRAGLVADVAAALGGCQLDETIAYLTTDAKPESVWVRAWKVLDWMPFGVKPLRAYLRERNVGTVTVKKRGTPVTPDALIPQLKLKGSESRTIVLTRCRGRQIAMICEDIEVRRD
jgi:hypothetical protein